MQFPEDWQKAVPLGVVVEFGPISCRACGERRYVRVAGGYDCTLCGKGKIRFGGDPMDASTDSLTTVDSQSWSLAVTLESGVVVQMRHGTQDTLAGGFRAVRDGKVEVGYGNILAVREYIWSLNDLRRIASLVGPER